ncbi:hypothetical protein SAMD00023353_6600120 [Rosellinia necatrix]|uniref:Uncharacterized protein n=1 Tax=Rosellinia necatrix TaxID=77044 RepID=A0A1S8AAE3_ROSNE|nr:hypothetical protein SAMD00023353_6600120 [Rosellinia necatrix]
MGISVHRPPEHVQRSNALLGRGHVLVNYTPSDGATDELQKQANQQRTGIKRLLRADPWLARDRALHQGDTFPIALL